MQPIDFEGATLREDNLLSILRDAAHGIVPVRDVEAAQNPTSWVLALVQTVAPSPLAGALTDALVALMRSADESEAALAVKAQSIEPLVDAAALWGVLFDQVAAGRLSIAETIAMALISQAGRGALPADPRLRDLLTRPGLSRSLFDELLTLAGVNERPWLLHHPELLRGDSDDDTKLRIANVAGTLDGDTLADFGSALEKEWASRGAPLSEPVRDMVAAMVRGRRKAR